jgi:hypothetical protein
VRASFKGVSDAEKLACSRTLRCYLNNAERDRSDLRDGLAYETTGGTMKLNHMGNRSALVTEEMQ